MLELKNITKRFGSIEALKDVSFLINDGDFVFITGQSGAGKTTLLRLLLREILPDEGEILIDDLNIAKLPRKEVPKMRRNIGVVFQDFKVLPERTVRENVEVALAVIDLAKKEWKSRVEHVLKLVGLEERMDLFPSQLSGGELQRVSMARALVVNPKIILADEPTGNLDWDTADKIMDLFEKINHEGKIIIMATHNKLIIDKMKKRIIELKDGSVVKDSGSKTKHRSEKSEEEA
ncbi:MAG: cell division ATP-binding protein, cell division transport system ATP-binding protein [Microgenomates group bacterium GW2011_GWC1_37_8]|uniref:Cell division ATP-binding protein FtsE n=2 Tax=Candidatus Woeseibacteriota TaxID=1752722 RepID=A0A0G0NK59_9BACT|nr:MAG: cell division ATP-binding protein, cell division transport system ATP-binding protein [Microgenomates group bacterium GW2011_GWC1_37_8]KKQ86279.1 MAG: Cell division ATP-binding protein FtsE [Candidatus Woesebacteria bacterium GW2011_GWB1_38_8]OGM21562.1 MAG: cell division ATP-binding protein FtsE [Candidatus Woesebacteria bacterium RIFCSPHIGHO2_01_FULL_38_9b]